MRQETVSMEFHQARRSRPWLLIVAALLFAVLSAILWAKWRDSRDRADQLQAEIKQAYVEAEALRLKAATAEQRVVQLERELKAASSRAVPVTDETPTTTKRKPTR
jgi:F0F1-type ATP synthase membrane subunit b/b'